MPEPAYEEYDEGISYFHCRTTPALNGRYADRPCMAYRVLWPTFQPDDDIQIEGLARQPPAERRSPALGGQVFR